MRQQKTRTWRVWMRDEQGGMVMEAALILPFFLAFVIALLNGVQVATAEMALQHAVSDTVKQVSAHYYFLSMGEKKLKETGEKWMGKVVPEQIAPFLKPLIVKAVEQANSSVLPGLFDPIVRYYADEQQLDTDNLQVTYVQLAVTGPKPYFKVEAEYRMPLKVPFFSLEVTLRKQALERVWSQ